MEGTNHYIIDSCDGEDCKCGFFKANHKVEEVLDEFDKHGQVVRHPFTVYLCCYCFSKLMGFAANKTCEEFLKKELKTKPITIQ